MMPIVRIRIESEFCGPVSVGTITPVKVLRAGPATSATQASLVKSFDDLLEHDAGGPEL